jgi:hypothetical protein
MFVYLLLVDRNARFFVIAVSSHGTEDARYQALVGQ